MKPFLQICTCLVSTVFSGFYWAVQSIESVIRNLWSLSHGLKDPKLTPSYIEVKDAILKLVVVNPETSARQIQPFGSILC